MSLTSVGRWPHPREAGHARLQPRARSPGGGGGGGGISCAGTRSGGGDALRGVVVVSGAAAPDPVLPHVHGDDVAGGGRRR